MYIYNSARVGSDRATKKTEHAPRNLPCAIHGSSLFFTLLHKNLLLDARTHARSQTHTHAHLHPLLAVLPLAAAGIVAVLPHGLDPLPVRVQSRLGHASNHVSVTLCHVSSRVGHVSVASRSHLCRFSVTPRQRPCRVQLRPAAGPIMRRLVDSCVGAQWNPTSRRPHHAGHVSLTSNRRPSNLGGTFESRP
jgi:hypothetical protein